MKITLYTTTNCQFSKQEKEYLTSHALQFEEKNLDTNKEFLTEMMTVGNNFAGTPVTKIEKDDGTITVLKGFTPEEFNTTLGFEEPAQTAAPTPETPAPTQDAASPSPTPVAAGPSVPDMPDVPTASSPAGSPSPVPAAEPPLNEVLNKLEDTMNSQTAPQPDVVPQTPAAPTANTPPTDAPAIPDFPADSATQPAK